MMRLVLLALVVLTACGSPPPPPAPEPPPVEPPPPPPPPPPPEPEIDPPVHECGQDPAEESPIVQGVLGEGERIVRLLNNAQTEVQARLLREDKSPAVQGTLHVPAGERGEFHVPAGVYMLRYRYGKTCEVRRGGKLLLQGRNAGVEIAIKPVYEQGTRSNMKRVKEPL